MRLVIDADPGNGVPFSDVDDGLAIALALAHPAITLEAITIVAGNTARDVGFAAAEALVARAGTGTPVIPGACGPGGTAVDAAIWRDRLDARRDAPTWRERYGGDEQLPDAHPAGDDTAAEYLCDLVSSAPGEITIAAIGPLTNIAAAIRRDPGFARGVAHIAVMGGAFQHDRMPQELNFGYDPDAAHTVLTSGANVSLMPFDVTARTLLTHERLSTLDDRDPFQAYLKATTEPWLRFSDERFALGGCFLHDPLVVAALIDPTLVRWSSVVADVVLADPIARGRPVRWDPDGVILGGGSLVLPDVPAIRVAEDVDAERFATMLVDGIRAFRVA